VHTIGDTPGRRFPNPKAKPPIGSRGIEDSATRRSATKTYAGPRVDEGRLRIALAALLIVHGLIHVIGPLATWDLVDFQDIDGAPTVSIPATLEDVLTWFWFVALLLCVAAGVALLRRQGWWVPVALVSVVVSQTLIVVWWDGAGFGTIANALVLAAVWTTRARRDTARPTSAG